jgi:hypothetical protein
MGFMLERTNLARSVGSLLLGAVLPDSGPGHAPEGVRTDADEQLLAWLTCSTSMRRSATLQTSAAASSILVRSRPRRRS